MKFDLDKEIHICFINWGRFTTD